MELRQLHVEIPSNERRNSARSFGIDEKIANHSASSKDRQISAISSAIQIVKAARVASSVIPYHRHGPRVVGDIKRSDTTTANNDGKKRGAILIRG
jgi:hypothetical protein